MSDVTKSRSSSKHPLCRALGKAVLVAGMISLGGCMSSVTSTIQASQDVGNYAIASLGQLDLPDQLMADALSIQRIVTAADTTQIANLSASAPSDMSGLPWKNDATGSNGDVLVISENTSSGATCRNFKTSRLSFDGVSLFKGMSCQSANGGWTLRSFDQIS